MGDNTDIEWTDCTWNPVTGCTLLSPGCTNCYAMRLAGGRLRNHPSRKGLTHHSKAGPVWSGEVRLNERWLDLPRRWTKRRRIFVCAHGDLFHKAVLDTWINRIWVVMHMAHRDRGHVFQVLTKRPERIAQVLGPRGIGWYGVEGPVPCPEPGIWIGTSIEDRARLQRLEALRNTPAAIRFLSLEPLLEDLGEIDLTGISWVIVGGESGPRARPMHPDWARSIRDQCVAAQVPFFFKQWGTWIPWEPEHGPCWASQHQRCEDHHALFPVDMDGSRDWDDGLWAVASGESHAAFQRVGKKQSGRLLDGRLWDEQPRGAP